jgi:acyl carrier protein phosphodiesterase
MNYLSHLFFSQRTSLSMAGNLMGDFKRGRDIQQALPTEILLGIQNHKLVDSKTDQFAGVQQLRTVFSSDRRRFAGVVTDIVFDYFLIKHWEHFAELDYHPFVQSCYQGLAETQQWMPERMQFVVGKMQEHDWLNVYATLDGIDRTINQVSKRIRFENKMAGAIEEVEANYAQIEDVFMDLFAHLKEEVARAAIEV